MSRALCRMIWIPSFIGLIAFDISLAIKPVSIPTPGKLVPFEASDKSFRVLRPENWRSKSMSLHDMSSEVSFKPARMVYFYLATDTQGSLMADISRSTDSLPSGLGELPGMEAVKDAPKKSPLEKLHEAWGSNLEEIISGYQEVQTKKTRIAEQEAFVTDYRLEGKGLWGTVPCIGRRISMLTNDRQVKIRFEMPESARGQLEPTFMKMAASVKLGEPGGAR